MGKLWERFKKFIHNRDEKNVLLAKRAAFYNGRLILKTPFKASASFGIIFISRKQNSLVTLRHEYGHIIQLKKIGFFRFFVKVAIPSVTGNLLHRMGRLSTAEYYGLPWEHEADEYGGVIRSAVILRQGTWVTYKSLVKRFFKKPVQLPEHHIDYYEPPD